MPAADQKRQRLEVEILLHRLKTQPGAILADEVGMGKTFVALAVAYCVALQSPRGPAIVMVPANLVDKWEQDLKTFCELYVDGRTPIRQETATAAELRDTSNIRYGIARHSIDLLRLLDDPPKNRSHLIFLAHGAMNRGQTDKWVRVAIVGEALRRHGRGGATRLILVKEQIHRFLGDLIGGLGEQRAHDWGDELWMRLLKIDPRGWREIFNKAIGDESRQMKDDPVPKAVVRALDRVDLKQLANALTDMPIRARGGEARVKERVKDVRKALRDAEEKIWKGLLANSSWRSPLLIMDEAHHLKNPQTSLARLLQSKESSDDLRTGDGAMANAFDRMLFLTATPFQLGHHELVRVLERFGDVHWDKKTMGDRKGFTRFMEDLLLRLNASQRTAIDLQGTWSRLRPEEIHGDVSSWWVSLSQTNKDQLPFRARALVDAFEAATQARNAASESLRPWVLRHNKGTCWSDTKILRRRRIEGANVSGDNCCAGLPIPPMQLLSFFLAARSVVSGTKDLLGEALCSSYEAFRYTRKSGADDRDALDDEDQKGEGEVGSNWYLDEFDRSLKRVSAAQHPKVSVTVRRVVDLWEAGEKVLVFAFYRHTCGALRLHISQEIERRIYSAAKQQFERIGKAIDSGALDALIETVQKNYFDHSDGRPSPGRRAVNSALTAIVHVHDSVLRRAGFSDEQMQVLVDIMRRFLRASTTLVRCFPLATRDRFSPPESIAEMLSAADGSGVTWRQKFDMFIEDLTERCSTGERQAVLEAALRTQTGDIRVRADEDDETPRVGGGKSGTTTLANVQVATGVTKRDARSRLMRAFNTPFFPDILVCSEVMSEGVDLQRFCRHVIHHDLAWNPSTIEQRTGRIDRLGCKAEGRQSIDVYLPYLSGAADERQFKVMSEREKWFQVVMGQDEVARLIGPESTATVPLPEVVASTLRFSLGVMD